MKTTEKAWLRLLEAARDVVQYKSVEALYRSLQPLRDAIEAVEYPLED